mmetsp:Transcript_28702/g.41085  ORF Transcript_28702/g.41085 Transcript_28702/m.41085 type:complete len:132 (+) Transcript_28702:5361-5756(+)
MRGRNAGEPRPRSQMNRTRRECRSTEPKTPIIGVQTTKCGPSTSLKSYEFTLRNERQRRRTRRRPTRQRARGRRGKRELQPLLTPRPERSIYRALQATLSSTLRRFTRTNRQQLPGNNMPFHPSNAIDNHP